MLCKLAGPVPLRALTKDWMARGSKSILRSITLSSPSLPDTLSHGPTGQIFFLLPTKIVVVPAPGVGKLGSKPRASFSGQHPFAKLISSPPWWQRRCETGHRILSLVGAGTITKAPEAVRVPPGLDTLGSAKLGKGDIFIAPSGLLYTDHLRPGLVFD